MNEGKSNQKLFQILFLILLFIIFYFFSLSTEAIKFTNRKVLISDSRTSASNLKYTFYWTGSTTTLKCIKILFCDTWTGDCNTPTGFNSTGVSKGNFSGLTQGNWSLDSSTTNGTLKLINSTGEAPATDVSLELLGFTNPANEGTYYSRIETFSDETCSTSVDYGTVSFTIAGPGFTITVTIPGAAPPPPPPPTEGPIVIISPANVIFEGRAYPKALLTLLKDGKVAATFLAESSGLFKKELTGVPEGTYTFGIWAEDSEGRRSVTLSFTVGILGGRTTTISGIFLSPTIALIPTQVERGDAVDIFGQVFPESKVNIFISSSETVKTVTATKAGKWALKLDTGSFEEREHKAKSKAFFGEGEQSQFSQTLSFLVLKPGTLVCKGADLNFDSRVNIVDFSILLYFWGQTKPANRCADINFDGRVDITDFSIMMYYWTG